MYKLNKNDIKNIIILNKHNNYLNLLNNPKFINNKDIQLTIIKLNKFYKNPLKIFYSINKKYNKLTLIGGGSQYPGDSYIEKYIEHNKYNKNNVEMPNIEDLQLEIKQEYDDDPDIKLPPKKFEKIKNDLNKDVTNKINNLQYTVRDNLNSSLQMSLKNELKFNDIKKMRVDFNNQMNDLNKYPIISNEFKEPHLDRYPPFY